MDIADIDTEYYKTVWTNQDDPKILKDELQNLINDCLRVKKESVAASPLQCGVIEPCPRCQGDKIGPSRWTDKRIAVHCKDCAYTGELASLQEQAIRLWNVDALRAL